ncbi:Collagen Alpha-5(Vi) Chain, partial [Manis pentadactyla]
GFCSPAPSQGPEGQAWGLVVRCRLLKSTWGCLAEPHSPAGGAPTPQALLAGTAAPSGPHGRERRISAFQGVPRRLLSLLCRRAPNRAEPRPAGGPARAPPLCVGRKAAEAAPPSRTRGEPGRRRVRARMLRAGRDGRGRGRCRARVPAWRGFCSPAPSQSPEWQAWGLVVRCRLLKSTWGCLAEPHSPAGGAPTPQALLAGTAAPSGPHGRERRISAFQGVPRRLLSLLCRRRLTALSPAPPEVPPGPRPSALDEKPPRPPRRAARAGSPGVAGCARGCSGPGEAAPLPRMRARVAAELRRCPRGRPGCASVPGRRAALWRPGDAGRAARPGARPPEAVKTRLLPSRPPLFLSPFLLLRRPSPRVTHAVSALPTALGLAAPRSPFSLGEDSAAAGHCTPFLTCAVPQAPTAPSPLSSSYLGPCPDLRPFCILALDSPSSHFQ